MKDINILGEYENIELTTLLRTFKKEGIENFVVVRKNKLENLIKAYKELEEKNQLLLNSKIGVDLSFDDYIPVSLLEEKIEELKNRIEKYREYAEQGIETDVEWVDNVADRETVKVLQELLEE